MSVSGFSYNVVHWDCLAKGKPFCPCAMEWPFCYECHSMVCFLSYLMSCSNHCMKGTGLFAVSAICVHVSGNNWKLGKVHPRTGHEGPERGAEVWLYAFFNLGARSNFICINYRR